MLYIFIPWLSVAFESMNQVPSRPMIILRSGARLGLGLILAIKDIRENLAKVDSISKQI